MIRVIRDLLRYDSRFRIAFVFLLVVLVMCLLSAVSPYDPGRTFKVPAEAGSYDYICSFPGHFAAGMRGKLVVK